MITVRYATNRFGRRWAGVLPVIVIVLVVVLAVVLVVLVVLVVIVMTASLGRARALTVPSV